MLIRYYLIGKYPNEPLGVGTYQHEPDSGDIMHHGQTEVHRLVLNLTPPGQLIYRLPRTKSTLKQVNVVTQIFVGLSLCLRNAALALAARTHPLPSAPGPHPPTSHPLARSRFPGLSTPSPGLLQRRESRSSDDSLPSGAQSPVRATAAAVTSPPLSRGHSLERSTTELFEHLVAGEVSKEGEALPSYAAAVEVGAAATTAQTGAYAPSHASH